MKMFSLSGEIAFVTGAGSGIGQRIAIGLAEAGADVAVFDLPDSTGIGETAPVPSRLSAGAPSCSAGTSPAPMTFRKPWQGSRPSSDR
jgi:NAD(P)-dependent dehydrogenase (short-subunit alcohol dehydrogenase family)